MKRDMDLIRRILLAVEEMPANSILDLLEEMPDEDPDRLREHAILMMEGGLVEGAVDGDPGGSIFRLTWHGHDFLGVVRDEGVWRKVQQGLKGVGGTSSMEVIKQLAVHYVRSALGLD